MNETINHIVIEEDVRDTPVARRFTQRFPDAQITICRSPADRPVCAARVGSPKRAVYLGRRRGPYLKAFPQHPWYGADRGCGTNLILGYNCSAACRYCFVQTIFDDPIPTLFVDSTEMHDELRAFLSQNPGAGISTGEYIDSLLFDDITGITGELTETFAQFPACTFELRTKSTATDHLPTNPIPQILVSYSVNPPSVIAVAEPGTPDLETRLDKARLLHDSGYRIALRFDPIIPAGEFAPDYLELPGLVDKHLGWHRVSKIFLGMLRFDTKLLERMTQTAAGRRLLDTEFVPCPDGNLRPFRHARIDIYRGLTLAIRERAPGIDISITMEPDYVRRAVFDEE
jgi:spore photoproduct lyase